MRKKILGSFGILSFIFSLAFMSLKPTSTVEDLSLIAKTLSKDSIYNKYVDDLYDSTHLEVAGLSFPVFEKALTGFLNLKNSGQLSSKSILTIADFDQASTKKRLYIIDLDQKKILLNTWVAHGQRSGLDEAVKFSNVNDSFTSSLGFYITGEIYKGIHGRSLKLDGMDDGFNDNARKRSIVMHGATYVSEGTINALGRLGRSQGCPAVAPEVADILINTISDKTVLFINKSVKNYKSKYLNETLAANIALDQTHQMMD